jgi:hypothetical protein
MKKLARAFLLLTTLMVLQTAEAQKQKKVKTNPVQSENVPPPPPPPHNPPPGVEMHPQEGTKKISHAPGLVETPAQYDTTAPPDDALTKEIRRYLVITGSTKLGFQFAKMIVDAQKGNTVDTPPKEFYDLFYQKLESERGIRLFENFLVNIYRTHYTVDDMQKMNEFYQTPVGKKILTTMPLILQESQSRGRGLGEMLGMEVIQQMMQEGKIK